MTIHRSGVRHGPFRGLAALLPLTLLLALPPVFGQDAPEAPTGLFGEVVDVRVVNVEVVVTKNGERVTGLGPEDFRLMVDGREVPIEYFTEVHGGTAVVRGDEASTGTLPALAPGTPVSTSYLVFVDEYFSLAPRRNRVLRALIEQLPVLGPEDRMAIVAYDGHQLEMLSTWSRSIEALTRVLEKAQERPAYGLQRLSGFRSYEATRFLFDEIGEAGTILAPELNDLELDIEEQMEAERIAGQVRRAALAASSALRGFANPPGRKVMLLLSGGWPFDPAVWVTGNQQIGAFDNTVPKGEELVGSLIDTANRLSYTIYPVDIENEARDLTEIDVSFNTIDALRDILRDRRQEERTSLAIMADDTGGSPLYGAARYSALERAAADTRSYYWIGFTPDWKGDDESHKISVKSRDKGLKVRSRDSFSDLSRQTEVSMMVESSLLFGDSPAAAPLFAKTGEGKKSGRGKVEVPLTVIIPVSELTFLPRKDQYLAEVELRVAVRDETGRLAEIPIIPMTVALEEPPAEGELRRYDTTLRLRKKKHDVVVSLYDNASGKILATRLEVDPAPASKRK